MIAELKPYADYKDSGVSWLGKVPAHWQIVRSKRLFTARQELARPDDVQLSATQAYGVIEQSLYEERTGYRVVKIAMHLDKPERRHVERDDFIISMRSFQGGLERAWSSGAIRSSYVVLKPETQVEAAYFKHLFKSMPYIAALRATGDFIRDGQDLNYSNFCGVDLPLVPLPDQAAISRFLDWANGRIDRTIRAKRKVIVLIAEQKQAIVHSAVTRGLSPDVPLKPTGLPWLGTIPRHWEIWRISRFARVGNGSTPSRGNPKYWHGGTYPWLNSSQVNRPFIDGADQFVTRTALRECHLPRVPTGSLLVAITGQGKTRGMSAILGVEATINQHIAYITPRVPIASAEFIHLAFTAAYRQLRAASEDAGSTKGAITCDDLKRFKIAVPPAEEQRQLVQHIQAVTKNLTLAADRLEREIDLLIEYRTRLTADVVTGKLDVREVVKHLPDVVTVQTAEEPSEDTELADEEAEA